MADQTDCDPETPAAGERCVSFIKNFSDLTWPCKARAVPIAAGVSFSLVTPFRLMRKPLRPLVSAVDLCAFWTYLRNRVGNPNLGSTLELQP